MDQRKKIPLALICYAMANSEFHPQVPKDFTGERKKLIQTFLFCTVLGLLWRKSEVGRKVLIN
jgi:hypothetical protein